MQMKTFINLPFYHTSQKKPVNGANIIYIHESSFYNTAEFRFVRVGHVWEEVDKKGRGTGNSFCFKKGDIMPDNCRLLVMDDHGMELKGFWMRFKDFDRGLVAAHKARRAAKKVDKTNL